MSGIVNGPVGNIVGFGIQAAIGGIPISPNAEKALDVMRNVGLPVPAKNWFTPKSDKQINSVNENNTENQFLEFYDNAAANLRDVIKSLTPAMAEIKHVIKNRSKSAEPILQKSKDDPEISYYSPENISSMSKSVEKKSKKHTKENKCPVHGQEHQQTPKSSKENKEKKICSKASKKSCSKKKINDELKNCTKCGVHMNIVKMFGILICGHVLCYNCIPDNFTHCPICQKKLT